MSDTELTSHNFSYNHHSLNKNIQLSSSIEANPSKEYEQNCRYSYVQMPDGHDRLMRIGPEITLISDALAFLAKDHKIDGSSLDCYYRGDNKPIEVRHSVDAIIGKHIRIERRSVFRLDLLKAKRSIGIRAKWKKTINEALISTLPKYRTRFLEALFRFFFFDLVEFCRPPKIDLLFS